MLDLNFVRDNLPLVEEKLRQRGLDPATVLKDFREVDTQRRQAITEAETLKARRNRASEDIGKLKKSGQDAGALMVETKDLREQIQTREKTAADLDAGLGTRRAIRCARSGARGQAYGRTVRGLLGSRGKA